MSEGRTEQRYAAACREWALGCRGLGKARGTGDLGRLGGLASQHVLGTEVGIPVGIPVGMPVGMPAGMPVGTDVGMPVGTGVG